MLFAVTIHEDYVIEVLSPNPDSSIVLTSIHVIPVLNDPWLSAPSLTTLGQCCRINREKRNAHARHWWNALGRRKVLADAAKRIRRTPTQTWLDSARHDGHYFVPSLCDFGHNSSVFTSLVRWSECDSPHRWPWYIHQVTGGWKALQRVLGRVWRLGMLAVCVWREHANVSGSTRKVCERQRGPKPLQR